MNRLTAALAIVGTPFVASAQPFAIIERMLQTGTYNYGAVEMLPNGNVATVMCGFNENDSRLYIMNRQGAVLSSRFLSNTFVSEMAVDPSTGRIFIVGSRLGASESSYMGCFDQNGTGLWGRVENVGGGTLNDGALDIALTPQGNPVVVGFVTSTPTNYGYCIALDGPTGERVWLTARSDMASARDVAVAPNGRIHVVSTIDYWQLSSTGTTLTRVDQPSLVNTTDIDADAQSVYTIGNREVGGRFRPWIQRRDHLGAPVWALYDPASTGSGVSGLTDNYLYLEIDASGYAHVKGTMANNGAQVSRYARYSPAGAITNSVSRAAYSGNGVLGRHMAIDPFNEIYTLDRFYVAGQNTNQTEITRYAPYPLAPRWRGLVFDAPGGGTPGQPRSIAVHPGSGDVVVLLGVTDTPPQTLFQVWRQPAMPGDDFFTMTGPGPFVSPRSVLTNDRYREDAKLALVRGANKGIVTLNVQTGNFTYTPNPGATGTDTFVYRLKKDGMVGTASVVTITLP